MVIPSLCTAKAEHSLVLQELQTCPFLSEGESKGVFCRPKPVCIMQLGEVTPVYQGTGSRTHPGAGTGLGTFISKAEFKACKANKIC